MVFILFLFVLFYRHQIFHVKDCFQQNRHVFDVIVTSWALFVFHISWNFARDISTVFEEIKHLRSRAPEKYFTRLLKQIKHKYYDSSHWNYFRKSSMMEVLK
jgi:hypothetical protein